MRYLLVTSDFGRNMQKVLLFCRIPVCTSWHIRSNSTILLAILLKKAWNTMSPRKQCVDALKAFWRTKLLSFKNKNKYTHTKMAQLLMMDDRSYADLDHGKFGCSALTFALFLIYCCDDPVKFLSELKDVLESFIDRAA